MNGFRHDAIEFLTSLESQLKAKGISFEQFQIDHLCYRVPSNDRFEEVRGWMIETMGAQVLSDEMIAGRIITTLKIPNPITYKNQSINVIELPRPKPGHPYGERWQHAEAVIEESIYDILFMFRTIPFEESNCSHVLNPCISLELEDLVELKIHPNSLEGVTKLETQREEFRYLVDEAHKDGVVRLNVDAVIVQDGKILNIHRCESNAKYPDRWCLPGGGVDEGESPIETLVRETREELNIEITKVHKLLPFVWDSPAPDGNGIWRVIYFTVDYVGKINLNEPDKHDRYEFIAKEQLGEYYPGQADPESENYRGELGVWDLIEPSKH